MAHERGASSVEYAVVLGMIAAVIVLAVSFLGHTSSSTFRCVGTAFKGNTCVQGVTITEPPADHECNSQNGGHGNGCYRR